MGQFAGAGRPVTTQAGTPNWLSLAAGLAGGAQSAGQMFASGGCWVASELFGGWYHPKTIYARCTLLILHSVSFI